jgi:hypothetical protein
MFRGLSVFLISLAAALAFKLLELYAGIENGFHPDSLYYVDNYGYYTQNPILSVSTINNLYYFIVKWLWGESNYLIFLNQIIFALTNVVIAWQFKFELKENGLLKWYVLFLPYRLHLCSHVLKDSFIIFAVVASLATPPVGVLFTTILNTALRNVSGPATLLVRFFPRGWKPFIAFLGVVILIFTLVPSLAQALTERGDVDMRSRDYFDVPLSNATSLGLIGLKAVFWPFLSKTGGFAAFAGSPVIFVLAAEPLLFLCWIGMQRRFADYFFGRGTLVLIIFSGLVTNYGAYYRYVYAFLIIDYVSMLATRTRSKKLR